MEMLEGQGKKAKKKSKKKAFQMFAPPPPPPLPYEFLDTPLHVYIQQTQDTE